LGSFNRRIMIVGRADKMISGAFKRRQKESISEKGLISAGVVHTGLALRAICSRPTGLATVGLVVMEHDGWF